MERVIREMLARRVLKNHWDKIQQKLFGFYLDEFSELDVIDELCRLEALEEELLTNEDKLWAANESEHRRLKENSYCEKPPLNNGG